MKHPPVSPFVRAILVTFVAFSVWQVWWLLAARRVLEPLLPAVLGSVNGWVGIWVAVGALAAAGAISGRDLHARIGFGAMASVCVMGSISVALDRQPMNVQFWTFGMAWTLAVACLVMLLSPMRNLPSPEFPPIGGSDA